MAFSQFEITKLQYDKKHWRVTVPRKWVEALKWGHLDVLQLNLSTPVQTVPAVLGIINLSKLSGQPPEHIKTALNLNFVGIGVDDTEFWKWLFTEVDKKKKEFALLEQKELAKAAAKAKKVQPK